MWGQINEIYTGYKNLFFYKLGFFHEEHCTEYKEKKKVCNKDCPLHSSLFGIGYCDPTKTHDGENGCGCILEAKLWSESPCPLGKF